MSLLDWMDAHAERAFVSRARTLHGGRLTLSSRSRRIVLGDERDGIDAALEVRHPRLFRRAFVNGAIGLGESFMDGDWTSPDLVSLLRLMLRNMAALDGLGGVASAVAGMHGKVARALRDNTRLNSRRNVGLHYDLGNDFFGLFLDANLLYSCAVFESADDTLESAQIRKLDRICKKLRLSPDDHLLEIGTGWGGLATYATTRFGCRVTTTTISRKQYQYAARWFASLGRSAERITLLDRDYRDLTGSFDKIVSIEMFEAVGLRHYDEFFGAVDRLLAPDGAALLQTITVDDQRFTAYRAAPDWVEKYIFPGGELAAVGAILDSVARATDMSVFHAENIGLHYVLTLRAWRDRFTSRIGEVRALGYDHRFIRMWDLYLAYCEAAFTERYIGDFQLLFAKNRTPRELFGDPPAQADCAAGPSNSARLHNRQSRSQSRA
jgi:cyclopropane-fatty-acyl-phospholipid synthase